MFASILEGLEVFKEEARKYLEKTKEIADRNRKEQKELGLDFCCSFGFPRREYGPYVKRIDELEGMMKVLGFSKFEVADFWKEIQKKTEVMLKEGAEEKKE